jgi:hypothetical protein
MPKNWFQLMMISIALAIFVWLFMTPAFPPVGVNAIVRAFFKTNKRLPTSNDPSYTPKLRNLDCKATAGGGAECTVEAVNVFWIHWRRYTVQVKQVIEPQAEAVSEER